MPVQPEQDAVEPLCEAVDGACWVLYDRAHRLLFIGRLTANGYAVFTHDIVTGAEHDAPWPIDLLLVQGVGIGAAFSSAVAERVNLGY